MPRDDDPAFVKHEILSEKPRTFGGLEILTIADMREPDLITRPLVKGFIEQDSVNLIYGPVSCGKTFFALDMALTIARGVPWIDHKVAQAGVVYVAAEGGRRIKRRVAAWLRERDCEEDIPFAAVVSPVNLCGLKPGDVDKLVNAFHNVQVPIKLVVIDTVSRALAGGNENSPEDMGAFVAALDALRDRLHCAVVAVHHIGKDASRGSRGHSLLHGAVDTEIFVERRDEKVSVATVVKQRDGETGEVIPFLLRQVTVGVDQDDDPVTTCVVIPSDYIPEKKPVGPSGKVKEAYDILVAMVGRQTIMADWGGYGVKIAEWREAMVASRNAAGQPVFGAGAAFRNNWSRAKKELSESGFIIMDADYIYLANSAGGWTH